MSMKRVLVILNPCAGLKLGIRHLGDILKTFCDADLVPTVRMTRAAGEGKTIAENEGAAYDEIVCIGGDGTFNEVVSGMIAAGRRVPIGYIPAGSTNDFANSLHLSRDVRAAARDVANGEVRSIDAGCFNGRPFTYVASFGAFSESSYSADQGTKNAIGHLAYVFEGLRDLSSIREHPMTFTTDTGAVHKGDYLFGALCNSTSIGGLVKLNPACVDMNDGLLEALLIRTPANAGQLAQILWCLQNKTYDSPLIEFFNCHAVKIDSPDACDWSLDGEYQPGARQIEIINLKSAIALVAPPLKNNGKTPE